MLQRSGDEWLGMFRWQICGEDKISLDSERNWTIFNVKLCPLPRRAIRRGTAPARGHRETARFREPSMILNWKPFTICCIAITLSAPLYAQRTGGTRSSGGGGMSSSPNIGGPSVFDRQPPQPGIMQPVIPDTPLPKPQMTEDESCLPWALSQIRGATVSVLRLEVPDKARSEYDKACGDFHKKKMADAEQHVRSAIEKYSNYVAAWVMLGQVLAAQQEADKAHEACSKANATDPTYLPPYLCLAELDAKAGNWKKS